MKIRKTIPLFHDIGLFMCIPEIMAQAEVFKTTLFLYNFLTFNEGKSLNMKMNEGGLIKKKKL